MTELKPAEINQDALRAAAQSVVDEAQRLCTLPAKYTALCEAIAGLRSELAAIPQEGAAARRAVLAEREACALIADEDANETEGSWQAEAGYRIAAAIRRRPAP